MKKLSLLITLSTTFLTSNLHAEQGKKYLNQNRYKKNKTLRSHTAKKHAQKEQLPQEPYVIGINKPTNKRMPVFNTLYREEAVQQAQKFIDQIHNKYKKTVETKELRKQLIAYYKATLPATKKELAELQTKEESAIKRYAATIKGNPEATEETALTATDFAIVYFKHHLSYAQRKLKSTIRFFEENLIHLENDLTNEYLNGKTLRLIWFN